MVDLSVNLNAVAQLRNRRDLPWPSVTGIARVCLAAGADGITVHPRPDERHIRRGDVFELATLLREEWPGREYNIEGYPSDEFLRLCEVVRPDQVTLVPDDPTQATSDHGWDLVAQGELLARVTERLQGGGMRVSLFVDADPAVAALTADIGADRIELFTGPYGRPDADAASELGKLRATAEACRKAGIRASRGGAGIGVNAGHDLTLENLQALVEAIPDLEECSIGHALTADALIYGFAETVRRYKAILGD
jgi:pyridoxine 5-phosphate synthase